MQRLGSWGGLLIFTTLLVAGLLNNFQGFVTNNRTSMPVHLTDHITQDRHIPGIFILNNDFSVGQIIDELALITEASFDDEYQDQIIYLPLP